MNDSLASSARPAPALSPASALAPIPSPDDRRVLAPTSTPRTFAAAFGHFLLFGFYGQIAYTVLELGIAASTYSQKQAPTSVKWQLILLIVPILFAIWGAIAKRDDVSSKAGRPLAIVALVMAMGALALFDLIVLFATMMTGYC